MIKIILKSIYNQSLELTRETERLFLQRSWPRNSAQTLATKYMEDRQYIKKALFRKSNLFLVAGTYLFVAISIAFAVFDKNNLAAPDLAHKLILFAVVLIVAAPGFSVGVLIMRLRIEHFIKTKDFQEFLLPTKGSLGNPDISILIGGKWQNVLRISRKVIYVLIILTMISIFWVFIWSLVTK